MGKLIELDAAYAVLTDYYHHSTDTQHAALREALGRVETVDAVPVRHGHWRNGKCDQCGGHAPFWCMATTYYTSDFCPHCGARMDGKDGDGND